MLAGFLWFLMFNPWIGTNLHFWPLMTAGCLILAASSYIAGKGDSAGQWEFKFSHILIGLVSAGILYGIFWIGNMISTKLFSFASGQVQRVHSMKDDGNLWVIGILLFFIIGPAEEVFWRGYIQKMLCKKTGTVTGFVITASIYTLVHIWSFNFMLLVAAAVCGGFWGLLYMKYRSVWPCIISHAVWDVLIFILLPIGA